MENQSNKNDEIVLNGKIYVKIAKSNEIREKKGYKFMFYEDLDIQIAIFRIEGKLYCVDNICPHRHQDRIFEGIINKDLTITCPLHYWTYSLETGENINKKQGIKNLKTYDIFEDNGFVWVEKPPYNPPKWRTNNAE